MPILTVPCLTPTIIPESVYKPNHLKGVITNQACRLSGWQPAWVILQARGNVYVTLDPVTLTLMCYTLPNSNSVSQIAVLPSHFLFQLVSDYCSYIIFPFSNQCQITVIPWHLSFPISFRLLFFHHICLFTISVILLLFPHISLFQSVSDCCSSLVFPFSIQCHFTVLPSQFPSPISVRLLFI